METSESAEGGWPAAEQMKVPVSETWRVVPPHPGHLHPGHGQVTRLQLPGPPGEGQPVTPPPHHLEEGGGVQEGRGGREFAEVEAPPL